MHAPPLVGAGPAAVVNPPHAGMPSVPLLEPELVVLAEVVAPPELVVEPEPVVEPVVLAEVVVPPELVVLSVVLPEAPPAPPVAIEGSLEPHRAAPRQQATVRICRMRAGARVVRVMSFDSS